MNKALRVAIALAVIALAVYAVSRRMKAQERQSTKPLAVEAIQLQQLAGRHSAVSDWDQGLHSGSYTAQVQKAVLRADSRPIAVRGRLLDVAVVKGRYQLQLSASYPSYCEFLLECNEGVAESLLTGARFRRPVLAIIAADSVEKPVFTLRASDPGEEGITVEIDGDSKAVVRGRCLAIEPVARSPE